MTAVEMMAIGTPEKIRIVVDTKQRRPACVLLQAAFGGDSHRVSSMFDASSWLISPTDDMRMVEGTLAEWRGFAAELRDRFRASLPAIRPNEPRRS